MQDVAKPLSGGALKQHVLSQDDRVYEVVPCPEWNCDITIRSLMSDERDDFETDIQVTKKRKDKRGRVVRETKADTRQIRAKLVALCICNGPGDPTPVFTQNDVSALGRKNSKVVDRLFEVAQRLCGLRDEDIEELTGN